MVAACWIVVMLSFCGWTLGADWTGFFVILGAGLYSMYSLLLYFTLLNVNASTALSVVTGWYPRSKDALEPENVIESKEYHCKK